MVSIETVATIGKPAAWSIQYTENIEPPRRLESSRGFRLEPPARIMLYHALCVLSNRRLEVRKVFVKTSIRDQDNTAGTVAKKHL